jgi:hypothetical protein
MFCPSCGSEERQASQFCRACGTDLRIVRVSLERPDTITESAVSAREDIGRAVADKIRSMNSPGEMSTFAEEFLPQIEKFLESPEEKRLRRLRAGVITGLMGLGTALPSLALTSVSRLSEELFFFVLAFGLGMITFAIGLGLVLNGLLLTRPRKAVEDKSTDARSQNLLDKGYLPPSQLKAQTTSHLVSPAESVTEHTTLHLKSNP